MSVKKIDESWHVDVRPNGSNGKRYRKSFETKAEALRWESWVITHKTKSKQWEPKPKDNRRLLELIELWYNLHGKQLTSGKNTRDILKKCCSEMGNPLAREFKPALFAKWRTDQIESGKSISTTNTVKVQLASVFNELGRLELWEGENPLKKIRLLKPKDSKTRALTTEEIKELLEELSKRRSDAYHIARICLATGARWSEAETLTLEQVTHTHIDYRETKSRKNRSVPISQEFFDSIPKREGRLFKNSSDTFRHVSERLSFNFPTGQLTHILRHSFASHFMQEGGNVRALQQLLGHANIKETMRYAHLAPSLLDSARELNPIANMDKKRTFKI